MPSTYTTISSLCTATTVVSAFGFTIVSPFRVGLAAVSFKGIQETGSLAILEAACTNESSVHPGLVHLGLETFSLSL